MAPSSRSLSISNKRQRQVPPRSNPRPPIQPTRSPLLIPELLTEILSHLLLPDLLPCQAVSRYWSLVIGRSPSLQRSLFLAPDWTPPEHIPLPLWVRRRIASLPLRTVVEERTVQLGRRWLHPVLLETAGLVLMSSSLDIMAGGIEGHLLFTTSLRDVLAFFERSERQSWRCAYATRPAAKQVRIQMQSYDVRYGEGGYDNCGMNYDKKGSAVVTLVEGVRIADAVDVMRKMAKVEEMVLEAEKRRAVRYIVVNFTWYFDSLVGT